MTRRKPDLPARARAAIFEDVKLSYDAAQQMDTLFKIRVYLAVEQGFTTQEIADALGVSQSSASKYRIQGEAAFAARQAAAAG